MLARLFGIVLALVGAGSLSQFPEFVQQYSQRLGGRMDELRLFVEEFDRDARAAGRTREQAIQSFETSSDAFLTERGRSAAETIDRYERFQTAQDDLEGSGPFERLWVFVTTYEPDIADATWENFEPAVPLTLEGVAHTGAGLAGGFLVAFFGVRGARAAGRGAKRLARRSGESDTQVG